MGRRVVLILIDSTGSVLPLAASYSDKFSRGVGPHRAQLKGCGAVVGCCRVLPHPQSDARARRRGRSRAVRDPTAWDGPGGTQSLAGPDQERSSRFAQLRQLR